MGQYKGGTGRGRGAGTMWKYNVVYVKKGRLAGRCLTGGGGA